MEALGQLAGGIVHDFNNLLSVIALSAEQLSREFAGHPLVIDIQRASDSGAALTQQLLMFARGKVEPPSGAVDLNAEVEDIVLMLNRVISRGVRIVLDLDPAAGEVIAKRSQITQVLINLALNSRDAMPKGGTITISTRAEPERRVLLSVTDTGYGMDEATQALIFDAFFTTKPAGTGLGLANVRAIVVSGLGGQITVESTPGHGSTFSVILPRA